MKIGKYVKQYIDQIFLHCDNNEIELLMDIRYSRNMFGIGFPFCVEVKNIVPSRLKRYWKDEYDAKGKRVQICSQWHERHRLLFIEYLKSTGITPELTNLAESLPSKKLSSEANVRYRGRSIGNSQNQFIRNILSRLGFESFTKDDWGFTKDYFSHSCAYCNSESDLVMEHAIPINKDKMGEHRLGNIVPSCKPCNDKKHNMDFKDFLVLEGKSENISRIEEYMASRNYVHREGDDRLKKILDTAYKEVGKLADKYANLINEMLHDNGVDKISPAVGYEENSEGFQLCLEPADEQEFKRRFIHSRQAEIRITYSDGREPTVKIWNGKKFTENSSVIGNIRSRKEFRRTHRQADNIRRVDVKVVD